VAIATAIKSQSATAAVPVAESATESALVTVESATETESATEAEKVRHCGCGTVR
jgi:hypothetical protein